MLNLFFTLFAVKCFVTVTSEFIPSTKGLQLFSITCDTDEKLAFVLQFEKYRDYDFISIIGFPTKNVEVAVTKRKVNYFKSLLEYKDIEYKVYIEDFEKHVKQEQKMSRKRRRRSPVKFQSSYSFDYFPRQWIINNYLKKMTKKYEDISLFDIGLSFENRTMYGVKISNNRVNTTKPAILIDGGIHAREWISITTALFTIQELVKIKNQHLYENVDWYIIPVMNPDGYEFSHTTYRMWRKTRSYKPSIPCMGVDANRNFGYHWMDKTETWNLHYSDDPCRNNYAGDRAFSEVETRNLRDFALSKNETIKLYIDLHSTSQNGKHIVLPWSFTRKKPDNIYDLYQLANKSASAISNYSGSNYTIGTATQIYYVAPGTSIDWFMGAAKSFLSYAIELPSQDFENTADKIPTIALEIFEAFKVFGKYVEDNYTEKNNSLFQN